MMPLQIGIVGLPNVGKSTLFNALLRSAVAKVGAFPFTTVQPHRGTVPVPDERLRVIGDLMKPAKLTPHFIEFIDIAGLVRGAHEGEGLGNQFLSHIRDVDAVLHVVRRFEDQDIPHHPGNIAPRRDREIVETELLLADLASVERGIEKWRGAARSGDQEAKEHLAALTMLRSALEAGTPARAVPLDREQRSTVRNFHLLTAKPLLYAVNIGEGDLPNLTVEAAREELGLPEDAHLFLVCAKLEAELDALTPEEQREFLQALALGGSALTKLVRSCFALLHLLTFFTVVGGTECRAWALPEGATAWDAAGKVHTDMQRGFICADVVHYDDFVACGGEQGAKGRGKVRTEGKEYVVRDGDIFHFRFSV
jgi:GTP-binding protein YchF